MRSMHLMYKIILPVVVMLSALLSMAACAHGQAVHGMASGRGEADDPEDVWSAQRCGTEYYWADTGKVGYCAYPDRILVSADTAVGTIASLLDSLGLEVMTDKRSRAIDEALHRESPWMQFAICRRKDGGNFERMNSRILAALRTSGRISFAGPIIGLDFFSLIAYDNRLTMHLAMNPFANESDSLSKLFSAPDPRDGRVAATAANLAAYGLRVTGADGYPGYYFVEADPGAGAGLWELAENAMKHVQIVSLRQALYTPARARGE